MNKDLKFIGYLLLYKKIEGSTNLNRVVQDIMTYLPYMDKFVIFNFNEEEQIFLIETLKKQHPNIEYAKIESQGEVKDYILAMNNAKEQEYDYVTILKEGYYYEDDSYKDIKRKLILGEIEENNAVISPMPIYTCEERADLKEESRTIKGAHLIGTFINKHIYFQTEGFYEPYYQTTFDYDYCLMVRQMGYNILLMNNLVLRNRNFTQLTKTILWHIYTAYHHDIYDVYYETRNRMHLWNKYKKFDPEYVKLDKKQQSFEFKEMRLFEKKFSFIKEVINQARDDYRNGKMGKAFKEVKF